MNIRQFIFSTLMLAGTLAHAHGTPGPVDHSPPIEPDIVAIETGFGRMGATPDVTRTVEISMGDDMRFTPSALSVSQGETIRILLRNTGKMQHNFMLGTEAMVVERAAAVAAYPDMVADSASSRRLSAGQSAELIWQFTTTGEFAYVCLAPGHAEAGMRGELVVGKAVISP